MIRVEIKKHEQGFYSLPLLITQQGERQIYYDDVIVLAAHGHLIPTLPNNDIVNMCFGKAYRVKPRNPDPNEGRARCTSL